MRPPGSLHWAAVQRHCAQVFERSGFQVALHDFGRGVNVIGVRPGATAPHQRVMVGAHYDHIPGCAGADDNGSGVAALLELARVLGPAPTDRTLVVACWDLEEAGLVGSRAWVAGPMQEQPPPRVYFNFDAIGVSDSRPGSQRVPPGFSLLFPGEVARLAERGNRGDFIALVTDPAAQVWARAIESYGKRIDLAAAVLRVPDVVIDSHLVFDLQRSDHAPFWSADVPAIMITDTADYRSDAYHCGARPDSVDVVDIDFVDAVVRSTVFAVATAARVD